MTSSEEDLLSMDHYMKKTFYKTASLMANSCKAVAILGGGSRDTAATAWEYGRNLGLAFQVSRPCGCWLICRFHPRAHCSRACHLLDVTRYLRI